jgi:hypothetical protein
MNGPRPARAIVAPLWPLFVLGLLVVAAACSSADEAQESTVPFMVCQSSQTWTRPSEEEQAKEVWHGPFGFRYDNWDPAQLRGTFYEDFFPWHGGNSEMFDQWPLHGLWTAEDGSPGDPACAGGGTVGREVISVFLLLHEAKEVRLSGNNYRITVEATPAGFQEIQFANLVSPRQPGPEYPTSVLFREWFARWARGSALLPESPAEEQPVPKEQPTDYNIAIVDTNGGELARAKGGIRFQPLTEAIVVPTATQEPTIGAEITK